MSIQTKIFLETPLRAAGQTCADQAFGALAYCSPLSAAAIAAIMAAAAVYKNSPYTIEVHAYESGGNGDLSCGLKIARILSSIPNVAVSIVTNPECVSRIQNMQGNESNIPVKTTYTYGVLPKLCIQIPICRGQPRFLGPWTTHWMISEYGICPHGMGLREGELGIILNEDLLEFSKQFTPQEPVQELALLSQLCSEHLRTFFLEDNLNEYEARRQLYYCYVSSYFGLMEALPLFTQKESLNSKKEIDVIWPGSLSPPSNEMESCNRWDFIQRFENIPFSFPLKQLLAQGITHCELHFFQDGKWNKKEIALDPQSSKRTLRIILPGCLPHQDCLTLLKASDEFCYLTGDQSISEGLSAGKICGYEVLRHKKDFFASLVALSGQIDSDMQTFLEECNNPNWHAPFFLRVEYNQQKLREGFRRLSNLIEANYNFNRIIIEKVNKYISDHPPFGSNAADSCSIS